MFNGAQRQLAAPSIVRFILKKEGALRRKVASSATHRIVLEEGGIDMGLLRSQITIRGSCRSGSTQIA